MFRTPVVSAAMDARIETTMDEFNVVSENERAVLRDSLLRLKTLKRSSKLGYKPKDEKTAALLSVYNHFDQAK